MFVDNLSKAVLQLCEAKVLSYDEASELCNISSRYFGSVARGQTAPTVLTLEKLCTGLKVTPNDLLLARQQAMQVTQIRCYDCAQGRTGYPICPRCQQTIDREYQQHCDHCGQRLGWEGYRNAAVIPAGK